MDRKEETVKAAHFKDNDLPSILVEITAFIERVGDYRVLDITYSSDYKGFSMSVYYTEE